MTLRPAASGSCEEVLFLSLPYPLSLSLSCSLYVLLSFFCSRNSTKAHANTHSHTHTSTQKHTYAHTHSGSAEEGVTVTLRPAARGSCAGVMPSICTRERFYDEGTSCQPVNFTNSMTQPALPPRGSRDPCRSAEGGACHYEGGGHCPASIWMRERQLRWGDTLHLHPGKTYVYGNAGFVRQATQRESIVCKETKSDRNWKTSICS